MYNPFWNDGCYNIAPWCLDPALQSELLACRDALASVHRLLAMRGTIKGVIMYPLVPLYTAWHSIGPRAMHAVRELWELAYNTQISNFCIKD